MFQLVNAMARPVDQVVKLRSEGTIVWGIVICVPRRDLLILELGNMALREERDSYRKIVVSGVLVYP